MGLVLTMAMLVTLVSAFFTLRSGLDNQVFLYYDMQDRLMNNARSGLQLLLSSANHVPLNSTKTIDLFEQGRDSVQLERKTWGAFEIIISKAFHGGQQFSQKALVGAHLAGDSLPLTLYVADGERPVSVCGHTKLVGKCYVPAIGFKRAYIEGQNYSGDKYVYGQQLKSERDITPINPHLLEVLTQELNQTNRSADSLVPFETFTRDSILNDFNNKTLRLVSSGTIQLDKFFRGNIKISAPKIIVKASSTLENVLLVASEIWIDDEVTGQFQAVAREKIHTGKKIKLLYPSVLAVIVDPKNEKNEKQEEAHLYIGETCGITGDLICYKENGYHHQEAWLSIDRETTVKGNVYVNGKLDIKGKIHGSTYCQRFFLMTNSGIYENHLLNAELDASKLPKFYLGAPLIKTGSKKEVLQWL